jgi:hypothetical protein
LFVSFSGNHPDRKRLVKPGPVPWWEAPVRFPYLLQPEGGINSKKGRVIITVTQKTRTDPIVIFISR